MRRFIAIWILLSAGLNVWQSIHIKKLEEKRPIIVYKADNAGAEIKGRVVHKEKIGDLYTITNSSLNSPKSTGMTLSRFLITTICFLSY